ncbi:MAG TPA: cysteine desulfurase [Gammaproteobacteria bacterium]|nr:cysteine desulfurase [Gammaproteobacteria bacterium]
MAATQAPVTQVVSAEALRLAQDVPFLGQTAPEGLLTRAIDDAEEAQRRLESLVGAESLRLVQAPSPFAAVALDGLLNQAIDGAEDAQRRLETLAEQALSGAVSVPGLQTPFALPPVDGASFRQFSDQGFIPRLRGVEAVEPSLTRSEVPRPLTGGLAVESIRADFPILSAKVHGRPLVWLDNGATTQKPRAVTDRLTEFYQTENSNIHRAAHELARRATDAYEDARTVVATFLGAAKPQEIIFVRGATEAINLVAQVLSGTRIRAGDEILVSHLEHHANIVPWQQVAQRIGARLRVLPVDDRGDLRLEQLPQLLSARTRLVAVAHVSNVLGTVTPVAELIAAAHRVGALVLVDGAQGVSHMPVDVRALGADFYVFSGHKLFGPTGIGAVYGREELLQELPPWQGGGNMIEDVTFEETIYRGPPERFEAGTGNIADAVGLAAAIRYLNGIGMPQIEAYEGELSRYGRESLARIKGLRLIGNPRHHTSVLPFVLDGLRDEEVGRRLDQAGIAVRAGHHCAQPILRRFGLESCVRASLAFYNTRAEVDYLTAVVADIAQGR